MSRKYDVKLSIEAEKDLQNIIIYIKDKLKINWKNQLLQKNMLT